ncbi:type III ribulose-bisphosphate carboxylase [Candidatus Bathyarchaeota archaeon]|nr:type III ribulose-bisphosphate carboxylase [Candidatus Bathyarchaeota archaeon]MBS7628373.1 type III ribulose-bisphosphate carboxylase [Candidatus Bathyarchaeota archaeon]
MNKNGGKEYSLRYEDFVNLKYCPTDDDLICEFIVEPEGVSLKEAAGAIAAESSIGTWTELSTMRSYVTDLHAKVFKMDGGTVKIAYPIELFEYGNMPNILSSIAGNVFGLKTLRNLRLEDVHIPRRLVKTFKGPKYGIEGVREVTRVYGRPLLGTIIKPKIGLKTQDHAKIAYEAWVGGCDVVKDDENLSGQRFNPFEDRVIQTLEMRDRAEGETGESKMYMVNVTAETEEMLRRASFVEEQGGEYVMVDILTCGWSALQTLRNRDLNLVIHAHRAGHAAFTRNPKHGISMNVIAKIVRIIGLDQLHVGAAFGKMSEGEGEVKRNCEVLRGDLYGLKEVMPVASGGLHPRTLPPLIENFGLDIVIQAGGGVHGHPGGTISGAKAMRQAIEASAKGVRLDDYAGSHPELDQALKLWL